MESMADIGALTQRAYQDMKMTAAASFNSSGTVGQPQRVGHKLENTIQRTTSNVV